MALYVLFSSAYLLYWSLLIYAISSEVTSTQGIEQEVFWEITLQK